MGQLGVFDMGGGGVNSVRVSHTHTRLKEYLRKGLYLRFLGREEKRKETDNE